MVDISIMPRYSENYSKLLFRYSWFFT